MASLLNTYMVYQFVRRLVTPFTQMPAYHLGLIDDNGDFIKTPKTQEELDASTPFDILVINLKRLIAKLPGGSTRLASFAAALYLLKKHGNVNEANLQESLNNMETDFYNCRVEADIMITEDGAPAGAGPVAVNSTGSAVAGTGKGDPVIVPNKMGRKYRNKNLNSFNIIL